MKDHAPGDFGGSPLSKKSKFTAGERALCKGLTSLFSSGGGFLLMFGRVRANMPVMMDGLTILKHSDPLATQLVYLGREYPAIRKALEAMVTGNAWLGVVSVLGAMGTEIAQNHGLLQGLFEQPESQVETGEAFNYSGSNGVRQDVPSL